jgi:23S rRNA pseudouridine1911/1915/1917 synthase
VHLTAIGCPLAGDGIYGRKASPRASALDAEIASFGRQALDAFVLGFAHPHDGRPLRFERGFAPDLAAFAERLRRAAASLGMRGGKG